MRTLILILSTVLSSLAIAQPEKPTSTLFIINKQSGFVPAENSYQVQCQIAATQTVAIWVKGRDTTVHRLARDTNYTARLPNSVQTLTALESAAGGTLGETTGPTDGPTSRYIGVIGGDVVDRHIKLLVDISTNIYRNSAAETDALIEMADLNCPVP